MNCREMVLAFLSSLENIRRCGPEDYVQCINRDHYSLEDLSIDTFPDPTVEEGRAPTPFETDLRTIVKDLNRTNTHRFMGRHVIARDDDAGDSGSVISGAMDQRDSVISDATSERDNAISGATEDAMSESDFHRLLKRILGTVAMDYGYLQVMNNVVGVVIEMHVAVYGAEHTLAHHYDVANDAFTLLEIWAIPVTSPKENTRNYQQFYMPALKIVQGIFEAKYGKENYEFVKNNWHYDVKNGKTESEWGFEPGSLLGPIGAWFARNVNQAVIEYYSIEALARIYKYFTDSKRFYLPFLYHLADLENKECPFETSGSNSTAFEMLDGNAMPVGVVSIVEMDQIDANFKKVRKLERRFKHLFVDFIEFLLSHEDDMVVEEEESANLSFGAIHRVSQLEINPASISEHVAEYILRSPLEDESSIKNARTVEDSEYVVVLESTDDEHTPSIESNNDEHVPSIKLNNVEHVSSIKSNGGADAQSDEPSVEVQGDESEFVFLDAESKGFDEPDVPEEQDDIDRDESLDDYLDANFLSDDDLGSTMAVQNPRDDSLLQDFIIVDQTDSPASDPESGIEGGDSSAGTAAEIKHAKEKTSGNGESSGEYTVLHSKLLAKAFHCAKRLFSPVFYIFRV